MFEDLENIKSSCVNTVILNLNTNKQRSFWDTNLNGHEMYFYCTIKNFFSFAMLRRQISAEIIRFYDHKLY